MGVTLDTAAEPVAQTILVNIFAPELIILGFLLVLLHSVYLSHILPVLTSKMFTRSEDREDYDRINAELKRLRKEAAPLNGPDTFAQYSLLRRKILVLERNLASIGTFFPHFLISPRRLLPTCASSLTTATTYALLPFPPT
jgi:hypothetical protein